MGTSLVSFSTENSTQPRWGVLREGSVHPLDTNLKHHRDVMALYFEQRADFDAAIAAEGIPTGELSYHSPLSKHIQMFAQGLNYASHRDESGISNAEEASQNLFFYKSPSSLCGPDDDIIRPANCELLDYEIELGIVLKRDLTGPTRVTDANLGDYIGALFLCNDVSARDEMFGASMIQWFKGKSFRSFCPAGPVLYLLEDAEIEKIYALELELKMNGEVRQRASTGDLIHKPPKTLTEISEFADLSAGDCILTGTPGGVLAGHSLKVGLSILLNFTNDRKRRAKFTAAQKVQQRFLQPGDSLELTLKTADGSIDLGRQCNSIVDA